MKGWIKLYRSIQGKGWAKKPDYIAIWIHILLEAAHDEYETLWNGKVIKLKPGQLISGRLKMAANTGVQQSKVERILKCFISEQQIEQQTSSTSRLITIINYKKYQSDEQPNERKVNNKRTTNEQRVNTIQEDKELKNNNTGELFEKFWNLYDKKRDREKCQNKFQKLSKAEIQKIFETLPAYIASTPDPTYRKNPATYLFNKSWNDVIPISKNGNTQPKQPTPEQQEKIKQQDELYQYLQSGE